MREIRTMCQARGKEIVDQLFAIANDKSATTYGRVFALKILAAYAWGNPISQNAIHLLDHRAGKGDGGEVVINVGFGKDGDAVTLEEFATKHVERAPASAPKLEDLRPAAVSFRRERLEEELRANEREIERLRRVQEQRVADIEPDRGWLMDAPTSSGDGWPGRRGRW